MSPRLVVIVAHEHVQLLDVAGPCDVFDAANRLAAYPYEVVVVSSAGGLVTTSGGLPIRTRPVADVAGRTVDTVLVPGTLDAERMVADRDLRATVELLAGAADRVASICTGAFVLGSLGLLDGRDSSTHWAMADELQARFPATMVRADCLVVKDGNVRTSGGVASGVDLALDIVADDLGHAVARQVAKWLIVPLRRPGGQSPFERAQPPLTAAQPAVQSAVDRIHRDPAADHRVGELAQQVGFSRRHFARVFREVVGTTPARYVEQVRLDRAMHMLETTSDSQQSIARRTGFADAEALRQSFRRRYGISPRDHRRSFGPAVSSV